MSGPAEKLRALDEAIGFPWKRMSPGEPLIEGPFGAVQSLCDLRNALPQIVAVVEGLEKLHDSLCGCGHPGDENCWGDGMRDESLTFFAPLTALDEALTAGGRRF